MQILTIRFSALEMRLLEVLHSIQIVSKGLSPLCRLCLVHELGEIDACERRPGYLVVGNEYGKDREERLSMRLSRFDSSMLRRISARFGIKESSLARQAIVHIAPIVMKSWVDPGSKRYFRVTDFEEAADTVARYMSSKEWVALRNNQCPKQL